MGTISFRPKIDWWLPAVIFGALGISTILILLDSHRTTWAIILIIVLDSFVLWVLVGSRYQLRESDLRIVFGPLRITYPLDGIVLARKGGWWALVSSFREPRLRMAFSRDNIIIETQRSGWFRRVVISPNDREAFLRMLMERAPLLQLEGF